MIGPEGDALRLVMRRVPCPVAVVTTDGESGIRGITVGSFTSVSLHPALISFNVNEAAQIYERIKVAEHYAVHIVGEDQVELANRFALPDMTSEAQFDGIPYHLDENGIPVIESAIAVIHCRRFATYPAGDHVILVGEVTKVENQHDGLAVVYHNRGYHHLGREVAPLVSASSEMPYAPAPKNA